MIHQTQSTFSSIYQAEDDNGDLMVLVIIRDPFTCPRFEFLIDPWYRLKHFQLEVSDSAWAEIHKSDERREDTYLSEESWLIVQRLGLDVHQPQRTLQETTDESDDLESSAASSQVEMSVSLKTPALATKSASKKQNLPKYCYQRLGEGEMRLFVLFPGDYDDPIRGCICHMPLSSAGPYRALSYVWGPDQQSERNLATPDGVLKIKAALGSALQRIRQKDKEMVLWVDAICINQEDTKEKVQQILLLPRMFQGATSTLAVLSTDDRSYQTVGILLQIAALNIFGVDFARWPEQLIRPRAAWLKNGMPGADSEFWQDVSYLFERPWFRRAWIVQESIAARTVQFICGKWIFDWNDLYFAMQIVDRKLGIYTFANSWQPFMILSQHREWEAARRRWSLFHLIQTFRYVKTGKHQRDRFFALLGLAADGDNPLFEPDYDSPFDVVLRRFAQGFVQAGYGMEMIYDAGLDKQKNESRFPSWVPDWTVEASDRGNLNSAEGRGVNFSASGRLLSSIFYDQNKDILKVSGAFWDTINCVSRFSNLPSQRSRYFQELDLMVDACDHIEPDRQQQLKETVPIAGALYPEHGSSCPISITESYSAFRKVLRKDELKARNTRGNGNKAKTRTPSSCKNSKKSPVVIGIREKSKAYASLLDQYILGWRFVTTQGGRCGIAPSSVLPGDKIAILSGGKVPFVVRESFLPFGGAFLIGQCYIDGMMFGEAVNGIQLDGEKYISSTVYLL